MEDEKPMNQASLNSFVVPVLPATGKRTPSRRTGAPVPRSIASDTPMGSHVIAHADAASRDADAAAAGGRAASVTDLFGPKGLPEAR